jgi:hypothetical protein
MLERLEPPTIPGRFRMRNSASLWSSAQLANVTQALTVLSRTPEREVL